MDFFQRKSNKNGLIVCILQDKNDGGPGIVGQHGHLGPTRQPDQRHDQLESTGFVAGPKPGGQCAEKSAQSRRTELSAGAQRQTEPHQ